MGTVDTCVRCGAELGVGRFCLNCGHRIGEPAPAPPVAPAATVERDPGPDGVPDDVRDDVRGDVRDDAADASPDDAPDAATPVRDAPMTLPLQAAEPVPVPPIIVPVTAPEPETPGHSRSEWDPLEELLPYEEVDELHGDPALSGRAWIAWVLGAVLLVGLVLVLLQAFGTDEDTASDPGTTDSSTAAAGDGSADPEEEAPDSPEGPRGVGRLVDLATGATVEVPDTAPPTTDFDGNLVAYEASQMTDGSATTAWRMAGDASGQTVTFTLPEPGVVSRVGLVNGYTKQVAGVDWYPNNRRILSVTWGFEDGTTVEQTFAERAGVQRLKVPAVQTGTVTVTISSVTPPGSGNLGRDYTAISEVSIIGRRAG